MSADSRGTVKVDGVGSSWTSNSHVSVGSAGSGTLSITAGGSVSCLSLTDVGDGSGSTGVVMVDGAGSTWKNSSYFDVGNYGNGTLSITSGGSVSSGGGDIGRWSGSTGAVTVDGADSTWTSSYISVGDNGSGTLSIVHGGRVNSTAGFIGSAFGSGLATVEGSGSTWAVSGMYVGRLGSGTLSISGGGSVSCARDSFLGYSSGSMGIVTVDGIGSSWTSDGIVNVGYQGSGTLSITNHGSISIAGGTCVGVCPTATGVIDFGANGGTLTTSSLYEPIPKLVIG